jgi:predicted Zn-dependent protease with MMP-like domain
MTTLRGAAKGLLQFLVVGAGVAAGMAGIALLEWPFGLSAWLRLPLVLVGAAFFLVVVIVLPRRDTRQELLRYEESEARRRSESKGARAGTRTGGHRHAINQPSDAVLEQLVLRALDELPGRFRRSMTNLVVLIEDEPPPGMPWLAVYQGTPMSRLRSFSGWSWPSRITVYRQPFRRVYRDDGPAHFESEVRRIVRHEVAHYFGISDARLIEIDRY